MTGAGSSLADSASGDVGVRLFKLGDDCGEARPSALSSFKTLLPRVNRTEGGRLAFAGAALFFVTYMNK